MQPAFSFMQLTPLAFHSGFKLITTVIIVADVKDSKSKYFKKVKSDKQY